MSLLLLLASSSSLLRGGSREGRERERERERESESLHTAEAIPPSSLLPSSLPLTPSLSSLSSLLSIDSLHTHSQPHVFSRFLEGPAGIPQSPRSPCPRPTRAPYAAAIPSCCCCGARPSTSTAEVPDPADPAAHPLNPLPQGAQENPPQGSSGSKAGARIRRSLRRLGGSRAVLASTSSNNNSVIVRGIEEPSESAPLNGQIRRSGIEENPPEGEGEDRGGERRGKLNAIMKWIVCDCAKTDVSSTMSSSRCVDDIQSNFILTA